MKKMMMVAILLIASVFSFGQAKQVVNKTSTTTSSVPLKVSLTVDKYSDKQYLFANYGLVVSRDSKKGIKINPSFTKQDGKWVYDGMIVKSFLNGGCNENDEIYFLFEDGTKAHFTSWGGFNCDNTSYFDESQNMDPLRKKIKGIKFMNGRTFDSYEMTLTDPDYKNYFINLGKALDSYNNK